MGELYDAPRYYEIAFSYRDIPHEVDVFEECIRRFDEAPVRRILEICCGHGPHMPEFARRGYSYVGVDRSKAMLDRCRERAHEASVTIETVQSGLTDFAIFPPADFAYVALTSLYVRNTQELEAHFNAVSRALRGGALYVLEWCVNFDPFVDVADAWETFREGVRVQAEYYARWIDRVEQLVEDTIRLTVSDHGVPVSLEEKLVRRALFPQEFLAFLRSRDDFTFVGWWNDWDLAQPLRGAEPTNRPIIIVRKNAEPIGHRNPDAPSTPRSENVV